MATRIRSLAAGSAIALCSACAGPAPTEPIAGQTDLGMPIVQDGSVYTPVSRSSDGCLLHRVDIPGGQAPAALMYRSVEGDFSYGRPARCVMALATQP